MVGKSPGCLIILYVIHHIVSLGELDYIIVSSFCYKSSPNRTGYQNDTMLCNYQVIDRLNPDSLIVGYLFYHAPLQIINQQGLNLQDDLVEIDSSKILNLLVNT